MNANETVHAATVGAIALPAPSGWAAEREAAKAAAIVAGLVGVPAVVAAGAVLVLFALTAVVLLAPLVAVLLTWLAWRCNRREALLPAEAPEAGRRP